MTMEKVKSKKPKKNYTSKEPEVFWYLNAKGDELWGFRHKYYDALGIRQEKPKQGLASENIAIRELLKVKTDLINGDTKQVDNSNLTVSEWADIWYEQSKGRWAISTRANRSDVIKNQIKPLLGKYKLQKLDRSTYIKEFINVLQEKYAVSTAQTYHDIFRIMINAAVENELIKRNRFTRIPILKEDDEDDEAFDNFLDPSELKKFLGSAEKNLDITGFTSILLLAYTGLRKGEAQALRWNDIDFKNKKLTVDETRDFYGVRSPKTKRSRRTIVISEVLIRQLKSYRKWCLETFFSIGKTLSDEDYIFIGIRGNPIHLSKFIEDFNNIYKVSDLKRITPHGLRHTHATILLTGKNRMPVAVIAKRLGNTPQMINNVYGHVIEEAEKESVESFDSSINF